MRATIAEVTDLLENCRAIKGEVFASDVRLVIACGTFASGMHDNVRSREFALGIAANIAARYIESDGSVNEEFARMVDTAAGLVGLAPLELHKIPKPT